MTTYTWSEFRTSSRLLLLSLLLIVSLTNPLAARATSYPGFCSQGSDGYWLVYQGKTYTDVPGDVSINGVYSETYLRYTNPCFSTGASYVLGANLTGTNGSLAVQIGYGTGDSESPLWFYWTNADNAGGASVRATWAGAAIYGHRIWTLVDQSVSGKWRFCVKDMTWGTAEVCKTFSRTWSFGTFAWWAYETHNTLSVMGTLPGEPTAPFNPLRYHYGSFPSAWSIRYGMPACGRTATLTQYHCVVYQVSYPNDAFRVYTQ
jgi:hypothetical protein